MLGSSRLAHEGPGGKVHFSAVLFAGTAKAQTLEAELAGIDQRGKTGRVANRKQ